MGREECPRSVFCLGLKRGMEESILLYFSSPSAVKIRASLSTVPVAAWKNIKCSFQINHPTRAGNLTKENRGGFYSPHGELSQGKEERPHLAEV